MRAPLRHLERISRVGWLVSQTGCSLVFDAELPQCATTADCVELGARTPELVGSVCEDQVCVLHGATDPFGEEPCLTHADCVDAHQGNPYLCRDGACLGLKSETCPWIIHKEALLEASEVVLIGGFAGFDTAAPTRSTSLMSYQLAMDEFASKEGGLPGGPRGSKRPFVGIICQGMAPTDWAGSFAHLTEVLEVPVILAALPARELREQFEALDVASPPLFISPNSSDSSLTQLTDRGLLWHLLPRASDLSLGYAALVRAVVESVTEAPIRLAMVVNELGAMQDIAGDLTTSLELNGKSLADNQRDGTLLRIDVESALLVDQPAVGDAFPEIAEFCPQVVLALAGAEFIDQVQVPLEEQWEALGCPSRPVYVMSPTAYNSPSLYELLRTKGELSQRLIGLNFAAARDQRLNERYFLALSGSYGAAAQPGYENFYDAAYFAMLSLAAAGGDTQHHTGALAAEGLMRLIEPTGMAWDIVPKELPNFVPLLTEHDTNLYLTGALGPPVFDRSTGARLGEGSTWCVSAAGPNPVFLSDQVRFDAELGEFLGDPLVCQTEAP